MQLTLMLSPRFAWALTLGLALVEMCALQSAFAQAPPSRPAFQDVFRAPTPEEALASPLSAKLVDRLAKALHDSAAPACRTEKKLSAGAYQKLARATLLAVGEHLQGFAASVLDAKQADADFESSARPGALQELKRLAGDPKVKEFLKLQRIAQSIEQTSTYLENTERALLLARLMTTARASPVATGDDQALLIEMETVAGAPLEYFDANQTPELTRLFELMIAAGDALVSASNQDAVLKWGPGKLLPILEPPLKDHCITKP